jgi:hypothetical protein
MLMLSFIFMTVRGLFEWKWFCEGFLSFVYICIAIGDPGIKRGGWYSINWVNNVTFVCLSQARTWISNVICHDFFFMIGELRWVPVG